MAILFSEVTVSAGSDSQEFLVAGIPTEYDDLEDNSCAEQFLAEIDSETEVSIHVEVYLYGDRSGDPSAANCTADAFGQKSKGTVLLQY